jgi:dolichyl-phosphate-mannose--protein O-mannosyl transferase
MGRVLYFHHYFPALLFSNMLSALTLDFIMGKLHREKKIQNDMEGRRCILQIVKQNYTKIAR